MSAKSHLLLLGRNSSNLTDSPANRHNRQHIGYDGDLVIYYNFYTIGTVNATVAIFLQISVLL